MSKEVPQINDWVRFYCNGRLVIGVVQYVNEIPYRNRTEVCTDVGIVSHDAIQEIRKPTKESK